LLYRPVRRADNLTTFMCRLSWNLGASTSWNPQGLYRPVMGLLYRPLRRADNLTTFMCRLSWNLVASTSWNPLGLSRPVMGLLYLYHIDGARYVPNIPHFMLLLWSDENTFSGKSCNAAILEYQALEPRNCAHIFLIHSAESPVWYFIDILLFSCPEFIQIFLQIFLSFGRTYLWEELFSEMKNWSFSDQEEELPVRHQ
jgi:hypothetical protein